MEVLDSFFFSKTNLDKRIAQAEYLYLNFFCIFSFLQLLIAKRFKRVLRWFTNQKASRSFFIDMIEDWRQKFVPTMKQDSFDQLLNSCLLFLIYRFYRC